MQRNISRRDFGKRLAGGAALLALHTELNAALASLVQHGVRAVLVAADPYFDTRRDRIIAFAAENRIPAIYQFREFAVAGGLIIPRSLTRCRKVAGALQPAEIGPEDLKIDQRIQPL